VEKVRKYLRRFSLASAYLMDKDVDKELKLRGATAEDVISIHLERYESYTIWYKSDKE